MSAIIPIITNAGLSAVMSTNKNTGLSAEITHIVLGDSARTASADDTALGNQRQKIEVAAGEQTGARQLHITAVADGSVEYWVNEVGFLLADGTMLAVWASDKPLAYKSEAVPLMLSFDLSLEALPADSVTVVAGDRDLSLAAYTESHMRTAVSIIKQNVLLTKQARSDIRISERLRNLETL